MLGSNFTGIVRAGKPFIVLLFFSSALFAQAPLDAYNTFENAQPIPGWTAFLDVSPGSYTYSGGSDNSPSARLDATGEYIMVQFAEKPGALSYFIRSTGIGEPVAPGTIFTVQQSVNGTSWTTLRILNGTNLSGNFTQFNEVPATNVKYIRFFYTNKASGSNIALDEILVEKAEAGPEACLMIYRNGQKVLSGSQIEFSASESVLLEFANEGLIEDLQVSSINWTGANASDFAIINQPTNIVAGTSQFVEIDFNGFSEQVYLAGFTVNSNDNYNPSYAVNCLGYGGNLAPEPSASAQNFLASNITTWKFNLSWLTGIPASDGFLVLQRADAPVSAQPQDGVVYETGNYIGNEKVVYVGSGNTFTPSFIGASRTYHYRIFPFNGDGAYRNYKQSNPLTGQVSTPSNLTGNYYSGLSAKLNSFPSDLTNKLFPHNQLLYADYAATLVNQFEARDTIGLQKGITCYYTGHEQVYNEPFSWNVFSREHVFPHSWFASYPAFEALEYSDYHNLFPVHFELANEPRSNHPFGIVQTTVSGYLDGKLGYDLQGNLVYEPRDAVKGMAARAMFYMIATYNQQVAGPWQLPLEQNQQLLKTWHFQNPPDRRERARNDYIFSLQGNRNAFIDSVHYACYLDFYTMSYIANPASWCVALAAQELEKNEPSLFPNPTSGIINIHWPSIPGRVSFTLFNATGKQVLAHKQVADGVYMQLDFSQVAAGFYTLHWHADNAAGQQKLLIY
jgi:endonuclease I